MSCRRTSLGVLRQDCLSEGFAGVRCSRSDDDNIESGKVNVHTAGDFTIACTCTVHVYKCAIKCYAWELVDVS